MAEAAIFHSSNTVPNVRVTERAGYFAVPGAHLYTVLHRVEDPVARVLLVGPFASERHSSYVPWVQWARYLAARNVEVLRYDYRGIGESDGVFGEMSFSDWSEDVARLAGWLKEQAPAAPLILHGLAMGGLLAARHFHDGVGDGLLLWSAPDNANQALRASLVRWVNVDQLFKYGDERKPPSVFIRQLELGSAVEVEGYQWSSRLWQDSFALDLPPALRDEARACAEYERPVKIVKLGKEASPLVKAGTVTDGKAKDFSWLFVENWEWMQASTAKKKRTNP